MPKLLICGLFLAALATARADLLVLHSGASGASAGHVARFDEVTGVARREFGHDNEGMLALAVSARGDIYVSADILGAGLIYRFDSAGKLAGKLVDATGTDFPALAVTRDGALWAVASIASPSDATPRRIELFRFDRDGTSRHMPAAQVTEPRALAVGPDGNLYVADADRGVIRFDGLTGAFRAALGTPGANALAFGPDGNLYVASSGIANAVVRFDPSSGTLLDTFLPTGAAGMSAPRALAFGPDGDLYVTSACGAGTSQVLRFEGRSGIFLGVIATERAPQAPTGVAFVETAG
jgi:DNA-binding beta-propeller fold protein YncE